MKRIIFPLFFVTLTSCSQRNNKDVLQNIKSVDITNTDSLVIETMMKQQKFDSVSKKIDSILPLKPLNQRGYYYYQKGFSYLMLENHKEAISNFEQAISLSYQIKASKAMIETAKEMQKTHDQYN